MKKSLKILLVVLVSGMIVLGGAAYSIITGKISLNSSDLLSSAFAEDVLMCNQNENGMKLKLLGPGIIEEVIKRLGLDEDELKTAWENGQTLLEFAESKGITKEKLVQTFEDVITEKLDELLSEGKISETEKANFLSDLDTRIEDFITKTPPFGKGPGKGEGEMPPGEPPFGKGFFLDEKGLMEEVLTKLNLTVEDFQSARQEGKSLLEFAESKGITKDNLVAVVKEVVTNKVNQLVTDGKMTEDEKTKFLENLDDFVERFISGPGFGPGKGEGEMPPGEPPFGKGFFLDEKGLMEEVLTKLNLTVEDFQSARQEGKSLLEFAESKGITKDNLVAVVKEVVTNKVNQLVTDGKMTEDEKTKFLENLDDFVERFISGPGFGPGRGHHGGIGNGDFGNSGSSTDLPPSSNL
ncbi:MAG TPA: hypothetical protein PL104_07735 [Caldisericia bacterium]|nr:hypothetical protein [Caldisericia bacterium]